jgi:hypothetical protein
MSLGLVSSVNSKGPAVIIDHYQNHHRGLGKAEPGTLIKELNDPTRVDRFLNATGTVLVLFSEIVALARFKSADNRDIILITKNPDDGDRFFTTESGMSDLAKVVEPGLSHFPSVRSADWKSIFSIRQ